MIDVKITEQWEGKMFIEAAVLAVCFTNCFNDTLCGDFLHPRVLTHISVSIRGTF